MSQIDDLITELCPDGVVLEPLANVGPWYGGGTPSKSRHEYWRDGTIPWVSPKDMGRTVVTKTEDYITEAAVRGSSTKLVPPTSIAMVVRSSILDRVLPTALIPIPVALNQDMKAVVPRDDILPGYIAHLLKSRGPEILRVARKSGGSVASIESSRLFSYRIPVPPMEVQREIVRILDTFSALEAELEAELEARRKQYAHYRKTLFAHADESEQVCLGDIAKIGTGSHDTKDAVVDGEYVFYARGRQPLRLDSFDFDEQAIITAGDGVGVGKVFHFADGKYALHQRAYRIVPNENVDARYIYHHLVADFARYLERTSVHASVTSLRRPMFLRYPVVLPPIELQRRISRILDNFESLTNDLAIGIPAELEARGKQYEHYRDRLLTFEEVQA